jgi:hypothetical protein
MLAEYSKPPVVFYFGKQHDVLKIQKKLEKYLYAMNIIGIQNSTFTGRDLIIPKMDIGGYRVAGVGLIEEELDREIRGRAGSIESGKPNLKMYLKPDDKKIRKELEGRLYALEVLKIPCKMVESDHNWDGGEFPELSNNGYLVGGVDDIKHSIDETISHYVKLSNIPRARA